MSAIEVALICLSLVTLLLTIACVLLVATLPWLWWRCFRLEDTCKKLREDMDKVDTILAGWLEGETVEDEEFIEDTGQPLFNQTQEGNATNGNGYNKLVSPNVRGNNRMVIPPKGKALPLPPK